MKLKQRPGDFRVEEILRDDVLRPAGEHRVYRVTKRKHTSLEAARVLGELAGVAPGQVAMAGLKDRQGVTRQYMSIPRGKPVQLHDSLLSIEPVGFALGELQSSDSVGNLFRIVVRDLDALEEARMRAGLPAVREHGLPNYFDEQRFGNLRHNQGWIALDLVHGRVEAALKRLLTAVSDHDDAGARAFKSALYRHWGDWRACRDVAGKFGAHHSLFEHLRRDEQDFAGAFRHVASRLRLIHLYAFQSHLWNRALALHLERACPAGERFALPGREGRLVFPEGALPLPAAWQGMLPLPGDRLAGVELADQQALFTEVLATLGLARETFAIEGVPGFQLKAEPRAAVARPAHLRLRPAEPDPENPGRRSARLSFQLPRGAYATLVVRRLVGPSAPRAAVGRRARRFPRHPPRS